MDGSIKADLLKACDRLLNLKLDDAQAALRLAEESLQSDTKSSAGDKFETGREMAQQEITRNKNFIFEIEQQLFQFKKVGKITQTNEIVQAGSLVYTNLGLFFVGVALGQVKVADTLCMVISAQSPLGKVLVGKSKKAQFDFMGKSYEILAVY